MNQNNFNGRTLRFVDISELSNNKPLLSCTQILPKTGAALFYGGNGTTDFIYSTLYI